MSTAPGPSSPAPPPVGPPPGPPVEPRPARPGDVVATVVLLVVLGALALLSLFMGLFLGMASDGCFDDEACIDAVGWGLVLVELGPLAGYLPFLVWSIVRMARRRSSWWVPLAGVPVYLVLVAAGLVVIGNGTS